MHPEPEERLPLSPGFAHAAFQRPHSTELAPRGRGHLQPPVRPNFLFGTACPPFDGVLFIAGAVYGLPLLASKVLRDGQACDSESIQGGFRSPQLNRGIRPTLLDNQQG
jgi:hypothetical protein